MSVVQTPHELQTGYSAMVIDVDAAARGQAEVKRGDSKVTEAPTDTTVVSGDDLAGVLAPENMGQEQPQGPARVGVRSVRDDADDLLRQRGVRDVSDGFGTFVERRKLAPLLIKWSLVVILATVAGVVTANLLDPGEFVRGQLVVESMNDPTTLLRETGVRELAITLLQKQSPGVVPGPLATDTSLRDWAHRANGENGTLTVDVPAALAGSSDRRLAETRLKALLQAVAERARPPETAVPPAQIALYADALKSAEANLKLARESLEAMEKRAKDSPKLSALLEEAAAMQKDRDALAVRLATLREAPPPIIDDQSRQKLDSALNLFAQRLSAIQGQQNLDARLAAFVAAAENVQDSGARLTAQILQRREDEAQQLLQLKKRLDQRMQIRQQQAWEADDELKRLTAQLDDTRRRYEASDPANASRRQDLQGEIDYIEGLIRARRQQVGADRADASAVAEVQRIIDAQAEATKQDRQRLVESFAQMQQTLTRLLPDAGAVSVEQRKMATELQESLNQLQQSRAGLTESSAAVMAQHEKAITELDKTLGEKDKALAAKRADAETVRASLPRTSQLDEARARVVRVEGERAAAARVLTEAQKPPPLKEAAQPTFEIIRPDAIQSKALGGLAGAIVLVVLGLVVRDRF
jgi:hypothetical protein